MICLPVLIDFIMNKVDLFIKEAEDLGWVVAQLSVQHAVKVVQVGAVDIDQRFIVLPSLRPLTWVFSTPTLKSGRSRTYLKLVSTHAAVPQQLVTYQVAS